MLSNGERLTLPAFRALFQATALAPKKRKDRTVEESIAGRTGPIRLRRYIPRERSAAQPAILFLHGGGWIAGGLDSHDDLCRRLVSSAGAQVIAVEYRLAPEHPFPAGVEDAIDAYAMLQLRAREWRIDNERIAVMGDGSGGALAAVIALHARDMCLPMPAAQLLLFPLLDLRPGEDPSSIGWIGPALTDWLRRHYVPQRADIEDWRLSPHRAGQLSGLPASFIAVDGGDAQAQAALLFAERLTSERVPVQLLHDPAAIRAVPTLTGGAHAEHCLARACDFLRDRFASL